MTRSAMANESRSRLRRTLTGAERVRRSADRSAGFVHPPALRRSSPDRSLRLVTRSEWEKLPPRSRGYVSYWQGGVRGSQIAGIGNPFAPGSREHGEYAAGEAQAVLDAQDSEE